MNKLILLILTVVAATGNIACVDAMDHVGEGDVNRRGVSDHVTGDVTDYPDSGTTAVDTGTTVDATPTAVDTNPPPACPNVYPSYYDVTLCLSDRSTGTCRIPNYVPPVIGCYVTDVLCVQICK